MKTEISLSDLTSSVISVPPFAVHGDFSINSTANAAVIKHIEAGGVSTLLYGGNANVQNWPVSSYAEWMDELESAAAKTSWLIPSVGPDWGKPNWGELAACLKECGKKVWSYHSYLTTF